MNSSRLRNAALATTLAIASASCYAPTHGHVHWNSFQQLHRSSHLHLTGHDPAGTDTMGEHLVANFKNVARTLRTHFMNSNPDNPYQAATNSDFSHPDEPVHPSDFELSGD